ncbi:hypothetical protein ES332_A02G197900v1 [Gossypium tomentosum]|uniref:Uncharacterized protein n=1 Tax=Gossypium tomentosum TaxID=34277 RepID=A0A5D2RN28_GOSTO|nr:hypothetical protein ES332_A02G197900v1 [Gossypium tomentosum]
MVSSSSFEPSFRTELPRDSRSEAESSLNSAANSDSDTLPNRIDSIINSLAVDLDFKNLMKEYFTDFEMTLKFCTALKDCLEHAPHNHGIIESALKSYDEEDKLEVETVKKNSVKALEEMRRFKAAEELFVEEFLVLKRMAHRRYESMQGKVRARKEGGIKGNTEEAAMTLFVPTFMRNKAKIKMKKKLTAIMEIYGSSATTIWMLVQQLEIKKTSLLHSVDCVVTEGYTLKVGMDDINEKLKLVKPIITDLLRETEECSYKFRTDREEIQRQMTLML